MSHEWALICSRSVLKRALTEIAWYVDHDKAREIATKALAESQKIYEDEVRRVLSHE